MDKRLIVSVELPIDSLVRRARLRGVIEHLRTPLYRNGYALIASTGITSILGLLYWAIAARTYDTETVGLNSSAISILIFLSGIAQINLQETMIRFIPQAGSRAARLILSAYAIVIVLSTAVAWIFCLGIPFWSPALGYLVESTASAIWFVFALILWSVFVIQDAVLTGLRQAVFVPIENTIFSVLKIVLLVGLATSFANTGIFISWTAAVAVIIIPVNILIFRRLLPRYLKNAVTRSEPIPLRQISRYIAGNYAAALFASMSSALLPIVIMQIAGAEANAHFYLAWIIAGSLQIITANMATSLTVEAAHDQENVAHYQRRALLGIARLLIPLSVFLIIAAPVILRFVGESYGEEGTILLQLLAVAALPNIYNMVQVALARINNRMKTVIAIYGVNAGLVLGLSAVFLERFGITGVGLAWVISQTGIAVALFAISRRLVRKSAFVGEEAS